MKVVCNRQELERGLAIANGAVSVRTPKPVLQCVRITADGDSVALQATDLEVSVRYLLTMVDIDQAGDALVPAQRVGQIARLSRDETLQLTAKDAQLNIQGADSKYDIYGSNVEDFPPVPDFSDEGGPSLPAEQLRDLLRRVEYAAAKENTRYAIHGVKWELRGNQLRLVATDGRRLATCWTNCESDGEDKNAILPLRAISLLNNILTDPEEPVTVRLMDNQAVFQTRNAVVATQLVEGTFPNYEDVIPKDNDKKVEFATSDLQSAVRRAALLTNEESRGVRFAFAEGGLTLTSQVPESGRAEINLPIDYDHDTVTIGFNPEFLLDALKTVDQDSVTIEIKDSSKPGVLKAGGNFVYVIMPVSL